MSAFCGTLASGPLFGRNPPRRFRAPFKTPGPGGSRRRNQGDSNRDRRIPHQHRHSRRRVRIGHLPIGPYRLEVSKQSFSTYVQTGIVLQVASNPPIDIPPRVGTVSKQVQLETNALLVETNTTGLGQVIESQRILELPLDGGQTTDLIVLAGAAIPSGVEGTGGMPGGVNYRSPSRTCRRPRRHRCVTI